MKINKDFTIEGWKPEEHIEKMIVFHNNEVQPRLNRQKISMFIDFEKYREAILFSTDIYKMRASGLINNTQARQYLDEHIGKLHK